MFRTISNLLLSSVLVFSLNGIPLADAAPKKPKVLMVTAEQTGYFQLGGLAHASTGLAVAKGADVLMPYYMSFYETDLTPGKTIASELHAEKQSIGVDLDHWEGEVYKQKEFSLHTHRRNGVKTTFLRHQHHEGEENLFHNPKDHKGKRGYAPSHIEGESFGAFDIAAAHYILQSDYDVVILNDWPMGLIAALIKSAEEQGKKVPKVIFAVHNMAYQGKFPKALIDYLGLDWRMFKVDGFEYHDDLSFFKAGLAFADFVYTVSLQYAHEIGTPEFGEGLDKMIQKLISENRLSGILNGIAVRDWAPNLAHEGVPHLFSVDDLSGKALNKAELQREMGLPILDGVPVITLTSRIVSQKGWKFLVEAIDEIAAKYNVQFAIMGDGEEEYLSKIETLSKKYPSKVKYQAFSGRMEKLATAGADFFMNAAVFEPCGLNQFFALLMGTVPIVTAKGGLKDSVHELGEEQNGFVAEEASHESIVAAMSRAIETYQANPELIRKLRLKGMSVDYSWESRLDEVDAMIKYVLENGAHLAHEAGLDSEGLGPSALLKRHNRLKRTFKHKQKCQDILMTERLAS